MVTALVVVPAVVVISTVVIGVDKLPIVVSSPPLQADAARPNDASAKVRNSVLRNISPPCDRPAFGGKDDCRASDGAMFERAKLDRGQRADDPGRRRHPGSIVERVPTTPHGSVM